MNWLNSKLHLKTKSINSGKKGELILAIQSKEVSLGKKEKWANIPEKMQP